MISGFVIRLAALALVGLPACGDSPPEPPDPGPEPPNLVTGVVQNNTANPIPVGTRVLVVWVVSAVREDYSYVYGEGSVDADAGTFRLELTTPPPDTALNGARVGVGIIILTTDASIAEGDDIDDLDPATFVGAAARYGVIYISGAPADVAALWGWAADFSTGFNVGVGQEVRGDFDRFVPVDESDVVVIIDDLANIEFVNWA
jgi:hypothetical protein